MTPHDFVGHWAFHLPEKYREVFIAELVKLLTLEQARERRRLCTDAALYQNACEETAEEIWRYVAGTSSSSSKDTVTSLSLQGN
jgi:hypothetical protein